MYLKKYRIFESNLYKLISDIEKDDFFQNHDADILNTEELIRIQKQLGPIYAKKEPLSFIFSRDNKYKISKYSDGWFIVDIIERNLFDADGNSYTKIICKSYKCDQFDGLISLLKDLK